MNIFSEFFEKKELSWSALTDGAPAMLGSKSGFATLVKKKNPDITIIIYSMIHREALASKTLPINMKSVYKHQNG